MMRRVILALALACSGEYGRHLYKMHGPQETDATRLGEMTSNAVCAEVADALERADTSEYECRPQ